jgi:hypothetical protein
MKWRERFIFVCVTKKYNKKIPRSVCILFVRGEMETERRKVAGRGVLGISSRGYDKIKK